MQLIRTAFHTDYIPVIRRYLNGTHVAFWYHNDDGYSMSFNGGFRYVHMVPRRMLPRP